MKACCVALHFTGLFARSIWMIPQGQNTVHHLDTLLANSRRASRVEDHSQKKKRKKRNWENKINSELEVPRFFLLWLFLSDLTAHLHHLLPPSNNLIWPSPNTVVNESGELRAANGSGWKREWPELFIDHAQQNSNSRFQSKPAQKDMYLYRIQAI